MFQRILVPTDGSDITHKAIAAAVDLAHSTGARLYALNVKEPFPFDPVADMPQMPPDGYEAAQERIAIALVKKVVDVATAAGVAAEAHTVEALHPWQAIIEHAKSKEIDMIVMASHGRRGVSALLLGSETQKVLTHTDIPVLVVR